MTTQIQTSGLPARLAHAPVEWRLLRRGMGGCSAPARPLRVDLRSVKPCLQDHTTEAGFEVLLRQGNHQTL